jgi:peptidoglycan/LPS O-acetylase OafA/YrhL
MDQIIQVKREEAKQVKRERVFFPNLDGLRFFSFFAVYLFHVYLLLFDKYRPAGPGYPVMKFLFQNGEVGVNFFFVLSGFLITYLLIEEKKTTGRIHVGKFYVRRILRIWPLFYLCLLFGFLIYPFMKKMMGGEQFAVAHPWTYFCFVNNFDFMAHGAPAIISVLWSVAIEEQFYLVWPLLLMMVPMKYYRYVFFTIIGVTLLFRLANWDNERVLQFHTLAVVGDMALGGLLAYYSNLSTGFRRRVEEMPKAFIALTYALALVFLFFRKSLFPGFGMVFERIFIGVVFGLIILEQNFGRNSFFKIGSFRLVSRLGIYTYGLYCLHVIAMSLTEQALVKLGMDIHVARNEWLVGAIALPLSIGAALVAYYFYERQFLKLKDRFTFITH